MQYLNMPDAAPAPTLILVHGSWHDGRCWAAVQYHLAAAGVRSIAPTLPGHGAHDQDRLAVGHQDYVSSIIEVLDGTPGVAVLVGHSFAGSAISRVAELRPDGLLNQAFANTADEHTLARIRSLLVPEPYAPIFETLSLPSFETLEIPAAYINCRDDRTLPPGTLHPGQSSRLRAPELIEIDGDHESLLTAPERLADALLGATDRLGLARSTRSADQRATV